MIRPLVFRALSVIIFVMSIALFALAGYYFKTGRFPHNGINALLISKRVEWQAKRLPPGDERERFMAMARAIRQGQSEYSYRVHGFPPINGM